MKTQSEMHTIGGALTTIICKRETTKLSIQVSIKVGYNDHVNSHEVEVTAFDAQGKSLRITSGEPDGNWSVISTGGAGWAFRIYKISLKDASRLDSIEISRGKAKQRFTANLPPLE